MNLTPCMETHKEKLEEQKVKVEKLQCDFEHSSLSESPGYSNARGHLSPQQRLWDV